MNLAKLIEEKFLKKPELIRLIYEDREISSMEIVRQQRKLATVLKNLGVQRGDRIIVQLPNCPEVLYSFNAIWRLGAVIVPINYLIGEDETAHIYRDSGAKVVISSKIYLPKIQACKTKAPNVKIAILIEDDAPEGTYSYYALMDKSLEKSIVETADDDIAVLVYTAGTTGKAKGVMQTHGALYANTSMWFQTQSLPDGMTYIHILPLCHIAGIGTLNMFLFKTHRMVLLNTFDLNIIFSSIEKYSGNSLAAVPTMYVYMLMYPDPKKYNLSSMKYWFCGSAPLAVETWNKFKEIYGYEIIEGWGLTEACATNCFNPAHGLKKIGSIGLPMKGMEMRIVNDDGKSLPTGEKGEIVVRGPQVMKGYWNRPQETVEAIKNGWLHTGDVGYVDTDGYYWITDRKKDTDHQGR